MNKIYKLFHLVRRFFIVWHENGLRTSLSVARAKIDGVVWAKKPVAEKPNGVDPAYKEIYNTYLSTRSRKVSDQFVEHVSKSTTSSHYPARLIAFYLPQFHPIPENDLWWGKGFTEWTNVTRAVPNFPEHYQPRLPGELGFYDLRVPEILRRQVELAKNYGLHGFCFHYYWFAGKRLLEKPFENYVHDAEIDFPFCVCWANENWTRRWDGRADDILIQQEHAFESDKSIIHDLVNLFSDPRYIRIDNRPVFIVYRANILKDVNQTVGYWRKYSIEHGAGDPYIIEAQTDGVLDPRIIGFDGVVEFPPNGVPPIPQGNHKVKITNPDFQGLVFDYRFIAEAMMSKPIPEFKLFKTVIPSWDNTPRRQNNSVIFTNSSPSLYQEWLEKAIDFSLRQNTGQDNIVFINAWNEWAESAYLEPDQKFGYAYLQATLNALQNFGKPDSHQTHGSQVQPTELWKKEHDTAVVLHLFYADLWDEVNSYLANLSGDFDLYVSVPTGSTQLIKVITDIYPTARIIEVENRGRDWAPFIKIFTLISHLNYRYVCKIHTKKSLYSAEGKDWRRDIFDELLGSSPAVAEIKCKLDQDDIGMIGPFNNLLSTSDYMGGNEAQIKDLAGRLNIKFDGKPFTFIAGSMFWFKPAAISNILALNLQEKQFPEEGGQRDATLAHAIERLICFLSEKNGCHVIQTRDFTSRISSSFPYATPLHPEAGEVSVY